MTEQEWLASEDPAGMLAYLNDYGAVAGPSVGAGGRRYPAKPSDRKLRLLACACVRQVWHLLTDDVPCGACGGKGTVPIPDDFEEDVRDCPACEGTGRVNRSRRAVEVAERFADGEATEDELESACYSARCYLPQRHPIMFPGLLGNAGQGRLIRFNESAALFFGWSAVHEFLSQFAALLRCVVGNPFRPVTLPRPYVTPAACGHYFDGTGEMPKGYCGCKRPSIGMNNWPAERRERQWACDTFYHVQDKERGPCPWLTPTVVSLAQAAYEERSLPSGELEPVRLAVLSDVLEEAGCPMDARCEECPKPPKTETDENNYYKQDMVEAVIAWGKKRKACRCGGTGRVPHPLLAHLRSPGPHVRGCWAVDLCLGKE